MLKQKSITIICMLCLTYSAMAGDESQVTNTFGKTDLNTFNTLSSCLKNSTNDFQVVDSENDWIAVRSFYPAYSFNVLKKALYAYVSPGNDSPNLPDTLLK